MALVVVGRPIVRDEGPAKVTGAARYTADVPLTGVLWGKCLRSPLPHARIVRIDTSRAARVPGVRAVLAGPDFPSALMGRRLKDEPIVARDRVRFIGERVAAAAAVDLDTAEEALALIDVEYEELPAVFDPLAAMEPDAPILHPDLLKYEGLYGHPTIPNVHSHILVERGDPEGGFGESDHVFEHTFTTAGLHQGYLEPFSVLVAIGPGGRPEIWNSNNRPFVQRTHLARALDMPEDWVLCTPVHIGGDFGGKGSPMDTPVAYQLARRTGRPIRMVMSYTEELTAGNPRHPSVIRLKTGVKRDGTIVARDSLSVFNGGAYGAHKPIPTVHILGGQEAAGAYHIPNLRMDSRCVYTNQIPAGFMRSPGRPQMAFAVESQMDIIARELDLDPVDLRLRNVLRDGDLSGRGQCYYHTKGPETLRAAAAASALGQPRLPLASPPALGGEAPGEAAGIAPPAASVAAEEPGGGPRTSGAAGGSALGPRSAAAGQRLVGRGLAFGDRPVGAGPTGMLLRLHPDGRVEVRYGVPDQGVGMSTMLRQVVAETLGLPVEQVSAGPADTDSAPYDIGAGASRHTYIGGRAAFHAAEDLAARLSETAAALLGTAPTEVRRQDGAYAGGARSVPFEAVAERAARAAGGVLEVRNALDLPDPDQTCFLAVVAEVEVDPETGQVHLRRLVSAHDVGTVINPTNHQGQIEGGVMQGIGQGLMEEIVVEEGRVMTPNLGEYKLPTIADIPALSTVLVEGGGGPGPYGSKAIGEAALILPPVAIANAVYDACGVRIYSLPITAEKVWRALRERGGAQP
jgi:CO/xanthine dehydrogenase Mo-binding subunit